jgi:hypothetical protein
MKEDMAKGRKVPEDLMGTILGESAGPRDVETGTLPPALGGEGMISWEDQPWLVGTTFNLSKQVGRELDRLRLDLQHQEDIHTSNSEIAEVALRIAVEDVRERGEESELSRRLGGRHVARISDAGGGTTRRSVDEAGWIFETTYDENGEIIDEDVVGTVADLPVMDEYVDEQGRLVSVAKDELGNTFEQIMDEGFNTLGTRLLRTRDQDAR